MNLELLSNPGGVYLTGEDHLRVTSFGAVAATLAIEGRQVNCLANALIPIAEAHTPNTDRTAKQTLVTLAEGWLTNLQVRVSSGTVKRGQVFVVVELVRGRTGSVQSLGVVLQGYVATNVPIAWPGTDIRSSLDGPGAVRAIVGTDPAAGAEVVETVPTGARWRLRTFAFALVASATVANRTPVLTIDDGANVLFESSNATAVTAGQTASYRAGVGAAAATIGTLDYALSLPSDLVLPAGARIRTVTGALQAGDNYGAPVYLVEEWIEP